MALFAKASNESTQRSHLPFASCLTMSDWPWRDAENMKAFITPWRYDGISDSASFDGASPSPYLGIRWAGSEVKIGSHQHQSCDAAYLEIPTTFLHIRKLNITDGNARATA
jgi:hypothetical protein